MPTLGRGMTVENGRGGCAVNELCKGKWIRGAQRTYAYLGGCRVVRSCVQRGRSRAMHKEVSCK